MTSKAAKRQEAKAKKNKKQKPDDGVRAHWIENPYRDTQPNAQFIEAKVSIRESPAAWMFSHGHLDTAQLRAANRFRQLYERAGGGGPRAMDTTKEPVDGGNITDGITDSKTDAAKELHRARQKLGNDDAYELVERVCAERLWIKDIEVTKYRRTRAANNLRSNLTVLAEFWGYQGTIRAWRKAG